MTVYITIMNKKLLFLLFTCAYLFSSSQDLVFKSKFPFNNVKNFYVSQNDKKQTLLHSYNISKVRVEVLDSTYKSVYASSELFDFVNYEFLSTFHNQDNFHNIYLNGKELAMAIIAPKATTPYRFIKIGAITKDASEEFFCYNELDNKGQFITINRKESKINLLTVTHKGITERKVYDSPVELTRKFDNSNPGASDDREKPNFTLIENGRPQEISTTSNTSKCYFYGNKEIIAFRGNSENKDFFCTKFLIFDSVQKSFTYKEIIDSTIGEQYVRYDNTNYTFYKDNIHFIQLNSVGYSLVKFNLDFQLISKTFYPFSEQVSINNLYLDGDNNATGNDIFLVDTLASTKENFLEILFYKKKNPTNTDFKSSIAINPYKDDISYTIGIARKTYYTVSNALPFALIQEMVNLSMGPSYLPNNTNYKKTFLNYVNSGNVNCQFRYFLQTTNMGEIKMKDYPNSIFRESFKNILAKKITIKELMLNDFSGNYYFSFINTTDNTLELHSLKK